MKKIITFLVRKIPRPILIKFSFLFSKIISVFYFGNKVECPVCGNHFRKFLPYGNIGSDNRLCPSCLSLERHRLLWIYLKEKTGFFTDKLDVLHIAPEQPYYKKFEKLKNLNYTTADIVSPIAKVKMDIKEMPFNDNSFDVLLCNHVLEHIDDELKATKEINRVLKPDGWAILQVPIDLNLEKTYEDFSITDPKEREKHFGQYDHVRQYGKDYSQRLERSGLKVTEVNFIDSFTEEQIERYRFDKSEIIYLCKKADI
ncbi:MAG: class I SAM-dependent methyltransferase [Bacteroidales bacterium]|nr:class I SAM-dependent methyltransferase [Bacteroidales bacterium]MBN2756887.1 class I SAM-dependent methyltransferase [Bacteroidales bacterium]